MATIFISYSRSDKAFAERLARDLALMGAEVWMDVLKISAGSKWSNEIQKGLDLCKVIAVIITPMAMDSSQVEDEWQYCLDQNKAIIPLLLIPAKIHFRLNSIQYIDFNTLPYGKALNELREQLNKLEFNLLPLNLTTGSLDLKEISMTKPLMRGFHPGPKMPLSEMNAELNPKKTLRVILQLQGTIHKAESLDLIEAKKVLIGRGVDDDIPEINLSVCGGEELGVSRRHAELFYMDNQLWIGDTGSTNGTSLNDGLLEKHFAYCVRDGDELTFGDVKVVVRFMKNSKSLLRKEP